VLFLELALIRWVGSEVVHLSYFTNFILLGSFLGIGIGFLRGRSRKDLFPWAPVGLAILVVIVQVSTSQTSGGGAALFYFGGSPGETGLPVWVVLPVIFLSVSVVMALFGQGLARAFTRFEPLEAYRHDILGALAGIVAFTALSFLQTPPLIWGIVVVSLCMALAYPRVWVPLAGSVVIIAMLTTGSFDPGVTYSRYFKIEIGPLLGESYFKVLVNGMTQQQVMPTGLLRFSQPEYFRPYQGTKPPRTVLIIGAGTGVDVAVALTAGAQHVDAVEIDPAFVEIGRRLHPDQPFQSPKVHVYVTDGREFLRGSDRKYDLVLLSLLDSETLIAGRAGVRLESFLLTKEGVASAKAHVADGGTFAIFGYFPAVWMRDRMANMLQEEFGTPPCLPGARAPVDGPGELQDPSWVVVMIQGPATCAAPWAASGPVVPAPTDDRPFPYLRGAAIPSFYPLSIAILLMISLASVRVVGGPFKPMRRYLDLFFMGAAFLLLEAKSVVQFSLLFGATWLVNALVFAGVLIVVLLGIETARRVRLRHPARLYPLLFASLALAWMVPPSALLVLPSPVRFLAAVLLTFTPIYLANWIFSQRFRSVEASTTAFAANLLGAILGGVLEYGALIAGYRALLIVAAFMYVLAYVFGRRYLKPAAA
jgi:hypothetical protein